VEIRVRDPVHNFICLREKQVKLLETRPLQRLRGIRQLAMASLVFPGAVHTRFDHTLGVTHIAGLMAKELGLDDDAIELVELAALLHDIGHGPFSHVSENALQRYADQSTIPKKLKKEKIHELITAIMIRDGEEIEGILGNHECKKIAQLLAGGYGQPAARSIVSGPLDADKQDYLLRDSLFCGVQYGVFDIHQLHRSLVLEGRHDEEELMVKADGKHAVEQFVLAKYFLTTNVYRHKVRLITDQTITRAIVLGVEEDDNSELRKLFSFDNSEEFVNRYLKWDDALFMTRFASEDSSKCGQLLSMLRQRKLLKRVFNCGSSDFDPEIREVVMAIGKKENDALRKNIEKEIAEILHKNTKKPVESHYVIIHSFDIKSVRETSRNDEEGILIARDPQPIQFTDESTLFRSINEGYIDQFVQVYAPVEWATPTDKRKLRRECREEIKKAIEEGCKNAPGENAT